MELKSKKLIELHELIGGTDKHTRHAFSYFYGPFLNQKEKLQKGFRAWGVTLGVWGLRGIRALFPNAEVHGVDINPLVRVKEEHQAPNIIFHEMDGYDPIKLDSVFGDTKWDVIIEDGPHTKETQTGCLNYFRDKLAPDGVILVEDVPPEHLEYILTGFGGDLGTYLLLIEGIPPEHHTTATASHAGMNS